MLSTQLRDDLGADSLVMVELVMELEDEFDLSIPDAEYERLRTVGDVVRYVRRLRDLSAEGPEL